MGLLAKLPFGDVLFPVLLWVPVFLGVTLLAGALALRWTRRRLRKASRPTRAVTVLLVCSHLLVLPAVAGALGMSFSLHRSVAHMVDQRSRAVVDLAVDGSLDTARRLLGVKDTDALVEIADLRARVKSEAGAHRMPSLASPFTMLFRFPDILQATFWKGLDDTVEHWTDTSGAVTWGRIVERTRLEMVAKGVDQMSGVADGFRAGARLNVYVLLALLLVANGILVWRVRKAARQAQASPSP